MKIARILGLLLLGVAILISGCKSNKWTSDEFAGIWRMDTRNVATPQNAAMVALERDGRFRASSLPPGFLRLDDVKPDQVLSGKGTWSLTRNDGGREERVRLTFTSVAGSNSRNLPYGAELFIQGSSKEPRLYYFNGDPDQNRRVVFRR
jgi:hypothetical protein